MTLKLSEAAGEGSRGGGGEVLERAVASVLREAEAGGERVAHVEARVGVQFVQLARERVLRDALDQRAQLVRRRVEPFDEDDLRLAARARAPARVLAQASTRLVVNLARGDHDHAR